MSAALPDEHPDGDVDNTQFWQGAAQRALVIGFCDACARWHHPIRQSVCPLCHQSSTHARTASGQGTVYSFSVVRRGFGAFAAAAPYIVAYVTLDEGPTMLTNIVDTSPDTLRIGDRVAVRFADVDTPVPRFAPVI